MSADGTHTHHPCCSSHGVDMTCERYRSTHFVEVRPCCTDDARLLDSDTTCQARTIVAGDPWRQCTLPAGHGDTDHLYRRRLYPADPNLGIAPHAMSP